MKRRYTFYLLLSLSCAVAQPASAFWSFGNDEKKDKEPKKEETGTWSKLVSDAKGKLKEFEEDLGNAETPTWDGLKESAGEAMDQFAKDGKGFDIMKRATKKVSRKIERISADEDSALTGRFYDLKQPVDGKSAPLHREAVVSFIRDFMAKDWDRSMLEKYYSPKVKLVAPYFYLPRCKAAYAPEAFECNKGEQARQVAPQDWVVVYSGQVVAPESGTYRFAGMGDDALVVRFNKEIVLESGWSIPSRNDMTLGTRSHYQNEITHEDNGCALYQYRETPHWNRQLGGIASGSTFTVQKGKTYPIDILISEIPGNEFGFCLLIEKIEQDKAPYGRFAPDKSPTLALFRTNDTTPDLEEIEERLTENGRNYTVRLPLEAPPFAKESPIWVARPARPGEKRGFMERAAASMSDEDTAMGRRVKDNEKEKKNKPGKKDKK